VSDAVPRTPSLVAVIVAPPAAIAVTIPLDATVATLVFDDDHVTLCPVTTVPPDVLSVAVNCI